MRVAARAFSSPRIRITIFLVLFLAYFPEKIDSKLVIVRFGDSQLSLRLSFCFCLERNWRKSFQFRLALWFFDSVRFSHYNLGFSIGILDDIAVLRRVLDPNSV